jgi:hypothetical protein
LKLYQLFIANIFKISSTNLAKKNNSSITKISKKSGRPFSEVWKTGMKHGEPKGDGHYSGTCEYCSTHWKRAKPVSLKIHLTKCNSAPSEIREYWKRELYGTEEENSDSDIEVSNNVNPKRKKKLIKNLILMNHIKVIFVIILQIQKMN